MKIKDIQIVNFLLKERVKYFTVMYTNTIQIVCGDIKITVPPGSLRSLINKGLAEQVDKLDEQIKSYGVTF